MEADSMNIISMCIRVTFASCHAEYYDNTAIERMIEAHCAMARLLLAFSLSAAVGTATMATAFRLIMLMIWWLMMI